MVRTASELEGKHGSDGCGHHWNYGDSVEHQCGEGGPIQDAREGAVLSESIVLHPAPNAQRGPCLTFYYSWSRQIIEHERAEAAKEAAAKGQQ